MTRADVINEIDAYIPSLVAPPSAAEIADGWDAPHKQKALKMMNDFRSALIGETETPKWSIVRTMDSWGVSGELFDRACAISNHIRKVTI